MTVTTTEKLCERDFCYKPVTPRPLGQPGRPRKYCDEHVNGPRVRMQQHKRPEPEMQQEKKTEPRKQEKTQHKHFPALLAFLRAGRNVYLYGPSGSGKTEGARLAAQELGIPFFERPCHPLMNAEDIEGFQGPSGYVSAVAREWLESEIGGVLLLDEMDASNPGLLIAVNLMTALRIGQSMRFPDGTRLTRTKNHVIVGAGNTNGLGANETYQGRSALDRATLTRFAFLEWDTDERVERAIVGTDNVGDLWVTHVQAVRQVVKRSNGQIPLLITMRASIEGAEMLRAGMARSIVEDAYIWQGCDPDTRSTVKAQLAAS